MRHGIPVLQPEKVRLTEEIEKVLALKPDLIVTAAFGQILPKELLDSPKYGCINVHASLLPELRGGATDPLFHSAGKEENRGYHYVYGRKIGCGRYDLKSGSGH